ncbi:MAG: hypothetical protein GEU91_14520 [Rhizobiales bacterium]|nr:hypothetical protein [Hyphomicrobiales bacterium]
MTRWTSYIAAASVLTAVAATAAWAQQSRSVPVSGSITAVDGAMLTVKAKDSAVLKIKLKDNAAVFGVVKATLADVKPGSFIGVGAMPQPDGSQRAIRVTIFAETQRGLGEGHRPWDRPNSTMTNATVDETVKSVDGQVLMVKYKGGEKKIVVPPEAAILAYLVGDKNELKPGANIRITRAVKQADGTYEADRVNVGRGGVVP